MFGTRVAWVCYVCLLLCKEKSFLSNVFAITERRDMSPYEGAHIYAIVVFWDGDYVSQLPYVRYYVIVKSGLNILSRNGSLRGQICLGV